MPPFTLCAPLTQVSLLLIDCTISVPTNGQRGAWPKFGALLIPWPADWALKPDGRSKRTCGRRFCELLEGKMRGSGIAPWASFSGSRLSSYVLVPPTAEDSTVSRGFTPCLPRVTPY